MQISGETGPLFERRPPCVGGSGLRQGRDPGPGRTKPAAGRPRARQQGRQCHQVLQHGGGHHRNGRAIVRSGEDVQRCNLRHASGQGPDNEPEVPPAEATGAELVQRDQQRQQGPRGRRHARERRRHRDLGAGIDRPPAPPRTAPGHDQRQALASRHKHRANFTSYALAFAATDALIAGAWLAIVAWLSDRARALLHRPACAAQWTGPPRPRWSRSA